MDYQDINAKTINGWIKDGWEWGIPISHETFTAAKNGDWNIHLTPTKNVPHDWIGDVAGRKILGLASGGGQQMPILAARGAVCTVLDFSESQIKSELTVAKREGYKIETIRGDMTKGEYFSQVWTTVSISCSVTMRLMWSIISRLTRSVTRNR